MPNESSTFQPPTDRHATTFPAISLLRAAAALLVVLYHVIVIGKWLEYPIAGPMLIGRAGWIGVDLFLVISGFVIGLSALNDYRRNGKGFVGGFARRRLVRIAPLYLFTGVVYLFLVEPSLLFADWPTLALHLGSHLLFVHNLLPTTHGSIDGPNWSIALEMQFYLAIMLATPWLSRCKVRWLLPALIVVAIVWRAGMVWIIGLGVDKAHLLHVYTSQLPGTLDSFGMGIGLALGVTADRPSRWLKPSWFTCGCWALAFLASYAVTFEIYWARASYWDQAAMVIFWRTSLALTCLCLVAMAVTLPVSAQRSRAVAVPGYLGEISYGIYLWHIPVLTTFTAYAWLTGSRLLTVVILGAVTLAAFSWHFMEKPMIQRFR